MGATITQEQGAALIAQQFRRTFSRQALRKHIDKGNIRRALVLDGAGKVVGVDADLLLEEYEANVNHGRRTGEPIPGRQRDGQPPPGRATTAAPQPPTDRELQAFIQGLPEDQIPDLNDSRARREHYLAEKARLEALRGREELVPSDQVKAEAFASARAVRDALLGLADRLAPMLAATADARECHRLLTEEHRVALRGLANG